MATHDDQTTTYAIIEESGGQRKVTEGESIYIDLHNAGESSVGDAITIDKVLVVGKPGGDAAIGTPLVDGASVTLESRTPWSRATSSRSTSSAPRAPTSARRATASATPASRSHKSAGDPLTKFRVRLSLRAWKISRARGILHMCVLRKWSTPCVRC